MRFISLAGAALRDIKIDWQAPVDLTDAVRDAMAGHPVEAMRAGKLRRGYQIAGVELARGALAFSHDPVRREVFIEVFERELPDDDGEHEAVADQQGVHHRVVVEGARDGERIDQALAAVTGLSRASVQRSIEDGLVSLAGAVISKPGHRVRGGDEIMLVAPAAAPIELVAETIPLVVLFEDSELIVIDKPAGMVVHPSLGHPRGTLVNALLHHCHDLAGINGAVRPGIVHRLDKDTSGVMVAAKSERAMAGLTAAFAAKSEGRAGELARDYLAICAPAPSAPAGTLRTLHNRHPTDRKRFSSRVATGKPAVTHWQIVESLPGGALVRFRLETGRTHQIRVHAADHGWPLLGDPLYGRTPRPLHSIAERLARQALHAELLAFDHPVTGAPIRCHSEPPADFARALAELRALG